MRQGRRPFLPISKNMNLKKHLLYAGALMTATSVPVGWYSGSDILAGVKKHLPFGAKTADAAAPQPSPSAPTASPSPSNEKPIALPTPPALEPMPTPTLAEVLRFDVNVDWVMRRWPRVSTGLQHLQLQGYRVTLVSGTRMRDVAGSLTYYFNAQQQVQRITLKGTTGDPSELAALLTSQYRFTRRLTNDPGLVLFEAVDTNNQQIGSLKIRSAKVIKSDQPRTRFEIDLVMDRS
jgi:hypothetical protein